MFQRISATFQSLYWNPLALTNARNAWRSNKSLATVVSSTCKDILVDNPKNIVVKNFQEAFGSENKHTWIVQLLINILKKFNFSKKSKICPKLQKAIAAPLVFTGAIYTLMLYGSTAYTVGSSVEKVGKFINQKETIYTGGFVKRLGKVTFLSGAVPGYIYSLVVKKVTITIPKFLIETTVRVSKAFFVGMFRGYTPTIVSIPGSIIKWTIVYPLNKGYEFVKWLSIHNLAAKAFNGLASILFSNNTQIVSFIFTLPIKAISSCFWAINKSSDGLASVAKTIQPIAPKWVDNLLNSNGLLGWFLQ